MFATTTTDSLSVVDPSLLKKGPSSIPSCLDLIEPPIASSWSPDNSYLYLASAHAIHRYEPISNTIREVYAVDAADVINHLVAKAKFTVIFSAGNKIHVLDCEAAPAISQTFESHKTQINSLSLSNDYALLSSTSSELVHVHDLVLGSHIVLKGVAGQEIDKAIFHPHFRTRLLVAAGTRLLSYDTTRPSSSLKTITVTESASGVITSVACSPFSKSLVAVATSAGFVGLVDLEKEKALFRTLSFKTSITAIGFSPEGAAIYLGTEKGKILLVDLRALDKQPKSITLSESGSRVQTISIQKKVKEGPTKTPLGPSVAARKASVDVPLPTRRLISTTASKAAPSPARPKPSAAASPVSRRAKPPATTSPTKSAAVSEPKKILSPARDPLGNSAELAGQTEDLSALRRGNAASATPVRKSSLNALGARPSPSPGRPMTLTNTDRVPSRSKTTTDKEPSRRPRTLPTSSSASVISATRKASGSAVQNIPISASTSDHLSVPRMSPQQRPRAVSSASRAGVEPLSAISSSSKQATKQGDSRPPSSISTATSNSRPSSSASRLSRAPVAPRSTTPCDPPPSPVRSRLGAMSSASLARENQTPSPDLPDLHMEPVTPVPAHKQRNTKKASGMNVLGLGTPEVDRWVKVGQVDVKGKGKGKVVGFQDESSDEEHHHDGDRDGDRLKVHERDRVLSMQISPRRPVPNSVSGSTESWATSPGAPNALNNSGVSPGAAASGNPAHDLLRTIVQDVMYDFQRETKTEMMGLHLDLLRMGRGWKTELRTLMDEYVGDLRDLREENQRLRLENERLRRGAY